MILKFTIILNFFDRLNYMNFVNSINTYVVTNFVDINIDTLRLFLVIQMFYIILE